MKKLFMIAAIVAASTSAIAQDESVKPLSFSIGAEVAMPIGDWADMNGVGIGGSAQADYNVSETFAVTLNAGYMTFSGKDYEILPGMEVEGESLSLVPVLAGAKYWFSPMFYGHGQVGMSFFTGEGGGSEFTYAPGVGVKFSQFDVSLKYLGIAGDGSSLSAIGLRAAYNF